MSNHQSVQLLIFNFDLRLGQFIDDVLVWVDFSFLLIGRWICENWIISPSASTFHHDSVEDAANDGQEDVLVAGEGEDEHADAVVMNVYINGFSLFDVKPNTDASSPEAIPLCNMQSMILSEQNNNQGKEESNECEEDTPENRWPILHNIPVKYKLLHNSLVNMSELQTEEESKGPHKVVV